jgi:hypothetical protein
MFLESLDHATDKVDGLVNELRPLCRSPLEPVHRFKNVAIAGVAYGHVGDSGALAVMSSREMSASLLSPCRFSDQWIRRSALLKKRST